MSQLRCSVAKHKQHKVRNQNHLWCTFVCGSRRTTVFCQLDRSSTIGVLTVRSSLSGSMPAGWKKMSATEIGLANSWYNEDRIKPSEIARRLKRDKSVITRHVIKKIVKKKQGRPAALSTAQVDFLVKTLDEMIVKADTETTVTAKMLRHRTRVGENPQPLHK
jgi:hypothetical protein